MWDKLIAYGKGPGALYIDLNADGFPVTREEAKKLYYDYCSSFEPAVKWLRARGREASETFVLTNMNGRKRKWFYVDRTNKEKYPNGVEDPKYKGTIAAIEREGGNFMIQSVNADMTKYAMILIRNYARKHGIRTGFVNQVYDEIVTETHKDDSEAFVVIKRRLMIEAAHHWLKKIPMEVEGHVDLCWTK